MLDSDSSKRPESPSRRIGLARSYLRRGLRQMALLRATSGAITHAPTVDESASAIERARDVLAHFEQLADSYMGLTAADLLEDARALGGEPKAPTSWQEAALAQLLLCAATRIELELEHAPAEPTGHDSRCPAFARVTNVTNVTSAMSASTLEHMSAARAALVEAGAFSAQASDTLYHGSADWLHIALATLEDEPTRERYRRDIDALLSSGVALSH